MTKVFNCATFFFHFFFFFGYPLQNLTPRFFFHLYLLVTKVKTCVPCRLCVQVVRRCPDVARVYALENRSVRGFPLWVIELTSNPGQHELRK